MSAATDVDTAKCCSGDGYEESDVGLKYSRDRGVVGADGKDVPRWREVAHGRGQAAAQKGVSDELQVCAGHARPTEEEVQRRDI